MQFLSPLFLVGAFTVAIPIALHLLKQQPDVRMKFSAVHLLRDAPVEHANRRRLRELILLACRIAALLLLATAFARPFFVSGMATRAVPTVVVVIDTSLSMSAPGQFSRAQDAAREAVSRAPGSSRIAVVAFDDTARVVARPSTDHGAAV
ncbi:MAG: BatA and WFA domain-containing protein, partial [Acidobacteriaceae bacterium]|nr:BatA and WFA domain-containing protein [Acidobacteriaceae bacterium]